MIGLASLRHAEKFSNGKRPKNQSDNYGLMDILIYKPWLRNSLFSGLLVAVAQQATGINCIISTTNQLFAEGGMTKDGMAYSTFSLYLFNYIAACSAGYVIQGNSSRKALLEWGSWIMAMFLLPAGLYVKFAKYYYFREATSGSDVVSDTSYWNRVSLFLVMSVIGSCVTFTITLGPVTWLYLTDFYHPKARGICLLLSGILNWMTSAWTVYYGPHLAIEHRLLLFGTLSLLSTYLIRRFTQENNDILRLENLISTSPGAKKISGESDDDAKKQALLV